jgi:hypothetical protein
MFLSEIDSGPVCRQAGKARITAFIGMTIQKNLFKNVISRPSTNSG